jgi:integrase
MAYAYSRQRAKAMAWYAAYEGPDGKVKSEGTFPTKRAAERHADKREREVREGTWIDPANLKLTFQHYVEQYYRPATQHLELTTRAAYESNLKKHFLPKFGPMLMATILPSTIQGWVNEANAGGLSARSIRKYVTFLGAVFERAVKVDRVIPRNPCDGISLPTFVRPRLTVITPEEFDAVLTHIPERYRSLVLVEIETGLRWGELIGLRPSAIDFTARVIRVERTIVEVSSKLTGDRFVSKDYPKSQRAREVQVSADLVRLIRQHMLANGIRDEDLLFTTTNGLPVSRSTFRKRVWTVAVEKAELSGRGLTFHRLRAAHASWLLAGGADLTIVMHRLGHAHLATTEQYLDVLDDAGERAIEAFQAIRNRAQDSKAPGSAS